MNIVTSYNIRLKTEYIRALKDTVTIYTDAVRYFINVILQEWNKVSDLSIKETVPCIEAMTHVSELHLYPKYQDFDIRFHKFPSYLRRAAISAAIGKCHSYKSNLANWEASNSATRGKAPSIPKLTAEMPAFYLKKTSIPSGETWTESRTFRHSVRLFSRVRLSYIERQPLFINWLR